ncbi:DNA-dependent ATPase protein rad54 [Cymbomonas tetramitiformis]|uniref:DNA-dependent ATPase protein rad54 n=1 Tax=Cymbomonas tetramitiformis TaxID=36881 RepID=A0AAE0LI63_9CHLO|nr:DNA-dependent ATPase protein rad54 [Cymbomonas tetramitiformis]
MEGEDAAEVEIRENNLKLLQTDNLVVQRQPLLPGVLVLSDVEKTLRRPFKSPLNGCVGQSAELQRRLASRKRFVPWGASAPTLQTLHRPVLLQRPTDDVEEVVDDSIEPLVLWEPGEEAAVGSKPIVVDSMLTKWLRQHQREGVQFIFECVAGLKNFGGNGCILADDMGLGKTLQGITLIWTLLRNGFKPNEHIAKRVLIVCPTSLVPNWDSECEKWLKGRVRTMPICESTRSDAIDSINQFLRPNTHLQVMIVSYETFRIHAHRFSKEGSCDLLMCDEAHRLKNSVTQTTQSLDSLPCTRRVLLSGTPLQNDLGEFYAMVNFCNPGVLGTEKDFNSYYAGHITKGREPDATPEERALGNERSAGLSAFVNQFILRRTNTLLSNHLPPKVVEVVCCALTPLQRELYDHFLKSKAAKVALSGKQSKVLAAITALRKLCNHPKLIYDMLNAGSEMHGFETCIELFPPGLFDDGRRGRGAPGEGWELMGGKFAVLARMLAHLRAHTNDKIVVVSNYTQTLELVAMLCRQRNYPCCSLNGSTTMKKRRDMVKAFNDPQGNLFVFLLSSKAGGCGLNLIGGNRLVLFDPDWNPANDKQAAARVWRDGQKKRVFVYRFLSTGTLEEKVFQRQMSKEGLQSVVNAETGKESEGNAMSTEELRHLFSYNEATASDTHDGLKCSECCQHLEPGEAGDQEGEAGPRQHKQVGAPADEALKQWGHHFTLDTVPDPVLQQVGKSEVTFVFTCEVDGKEITDEPELPAATASLPSPPEQESRKPKPLQSIQASSSTLSTSIPTQPAIARPSLPPLKMGGTSSSSRPHSHPRPSLSLGGQRPNCASSRAPPSRGGGPLQPRAPQNRAATTSLSKPGKASHTRGGARAKRQKQCASDSEEDMEDQEDSEESDEDEMEFESEDEDEEQVAMGDGDEDDDDFQ